MIKIQGKKPYERYWLPTVEMKHSPEANVENFVFCNCNKKVSSVTFKGICRTQKMFIIGKACMLSVWGGLLNEQHGLMV